MARQTCETGHPSKAFARHQRRRSQRLTRALALMRRTGRRYYRLDTVYTLKSIIDPDDESAVAE